MQGDLFADQYKTDVVSIAPGAVLMHGFVLQEEKELLVAITNLLAVARLRHLVTPGGYVMSVAMSNCGKLGWVSDRNGYRYSALDPQTNQPWPIMPLLFRQLARRAATAAGFDDFEPDACLINCYQAGARLSLHQDRNERDLDAPIVSVSLGLPATFLFGGLRRNDRPQRIYVQHGDVVVWGGPARLSYHGVLALKPGNHLLFGAQRINLTFRKAA